MEFLSDGGWVSNLGVLVLSAGWLAVGLMLGWALGAEREERKGYKRQTEAVRSAWEYWEREQQRRVGKVSGW